MNELLAFLFAAVISFWGSLQLGPVNVCVIETALSYGKRQALIVAFGGILPELIYSTLAVFGANWLVQYPQFTLIFGWIIVLLLFSLGIYYLLKPYRPAVIKTFFGGRLC
jgi:threonine/homoserine/homoserine lactone efflux protein